MYVDNSWLSLLHPHEFSDNFSDMDGFQDGGYIWAQGVLQYHLIEGHTSAPNVNKEIEIQFIYIYVYIHIYTFIYI